MSGKNKEAKQTSVVHGSKIAPLAFADEAYKVTSPSSYIRSLREGDPNEKVEVPMIHSTHKLSFGDYLPFGSAMKTGTRTVISRRVTRDCHVKYYAKDDEGYYIGTEKPYSDWQLVLVPNKSETEDILEQLNQFVEVRHDVRRLHSRKELKHIQSKTIHEVRNSDPCVAWNRACKILVLEALEVGPF